VIVISTVIFLSWEFLVKKDEPNLNSKIDTTINKEKIIIRIFL